MGVSAPVTKALGSLGISVSSERSKCPFLHEAFHTSGPEDRLWAVISTRRPSGALRFVWWRVQPRPHAALPPEAPCACPHGAGAQQIPLS